MNSDAEEGMPSSWLTGWLYEFLAQVSEEQMVGEKKKKKRKSVEVYRNKCILLFWGLNEYNEPAQALTNKD